MGGAKVRARTCHMSQPPPAMRAPSRQTDAEFQGNRARRALITLAACSTLAPSSGRLGLAPETYLAPLDKLYWAVVAKGDVQFDGALELVVAKPHCRGKPAITSPGLRPF